MVKNVIVGEKGLAASDKACSLARGKIEFDGGGAWLLFVVLDGNR